MDLLKGIEARSFGGNHRFRIGSNIWGILYLKAIRYGEELTQAMEARCFVGEYVKSSQSFTWKDWLGLDRSSSSDFRTDYVRRMRCFN